MLNSLTPMKTRTKGVAGKKKKKKMMMMMTTTKKKKKEKKRGKNTASVVMAWTVQMILLGNLEAMVLILVNL